MSGHFVEKCRVCQTVILQCRCPASLRGKTILWSLCDYCKDLLVERDVALMLRYDMRYDDRYV